VHDDARRSASVQLRPDVVVRVRTGSTDTCTCVDESNSISLHSEVVGRQLEANYGRGFGEKSLHHMLRFAQAFPDPEIVSALRRQLSQSHFKQLIYIQDELKRTFYAEMCRVEGWSTRAMTQKIDGMLFERTALSKKPET
jgi:hypothetical protein